MSGERFEYKTVFAKNELKNIYIDKYPYFGWELCDTSDNSLRFKRNKHISHIREIKAMQKKLDTAIAKIKKYQKLQNLVACMAGGIMWSLILIYISLIIVKKGPSFLGAVLLWIIALLGIWAQYSLRRVLRKALLRITRTAMNERLEEINLLCENVSSIKKSKDYTVYILLIKSTTQISKMINHATNDSYTHAAIAFKKDLKAIYSFSRKWSLTPFPAGLRLECLEKYHNKSDEAMCALCKLQTDEHTYYSLKHDVEQMMVHAPAYKFNAIGLIMCKFGIPIRRKHNYFCSQFLGEVLSKNNALNLPKEPSLMRPADYRELPELSCVFEGKLSSLSKMCS